MKREENVWLLGPSSKRRGFLNLCLDRFTASLNWRGAKETVAVKIHPRAVKRKTKG